MYLSLSLILLTLNKFRTMQRRNSIQNQTIMHTMVMPKKGAALITPFVSPV